MTQLPDFATNHAPSDAASTVADKVNELFRLLRYEIADARWQSAMQAIKDSVRVEGTKEYVRFYRRDHPKAGWDTVTIDVASA